VVGLRLTACIACLAAIPLFCAAETPVPGSVSEVIGGLPFTPEQMQAVAAGQTIATPVVPVSEGELAIGLACLTDRGVTELAVRTPIGQWLVPEEHVVGSGVLEEAGSDAFRAAIERIPAGSEGPRYARARPGADLNLSASELDRIGSASGLPAGLLQELVMARYHDYRADGLPAVAPYARGRGETDPGSQLRQSAEESVGIARYFPAMHATLLGYPEVAPGVSDDGFHWILARLADRDTIVLTHTISAHRENTEIVVTRAYYVSHSLNVLQAVTAVHPVAEGTLFLYIYRVWLDRVRGFAGSIAAGVAREVMTEKMQELARQTGACDRAALG